jgi:hypothetical protein
MAYLLLYTLLRTSMICSFEQHSLSSSISVSILLHLNFTAVQVFVAVVVTTHHTVSIYAIRYHRTFELKKVNLSYFISCLYILILLITYLIYHFKKVCYNLVQNRQIIYI